MYEVRVKPGHPTGTRRRDGMVFTTSEAVLLDKVPEAVRNDPWLVVTESDGKAPAGSALKTAAGGDEDLAALLKALGAENVAQARQAVELHLQFDAQRDNELAQAKTDLAARDARINGLESDTAELNKGLTESRGRIAELEKAVQTANDIGVEIKQTLDEVRKELAEAQKKARK